MTERDGTPRVSRREAVGLGGTALLAGLAGCSAIPPLGTQVRYGSVATPDPGDATYREWLPAPSALPSNDGDGEDAYHVMVHAPPGDDAPPWARSSAQRSFVATWTDYVGLHVDDADVAFACADGSFTHARAVVLLGDVDRSLVEDTIADTRYEREGSYGGYHLYTRSDVPRSVAVGDEAIVSASGEATGESLRAVVDARNGDVARYHEADDAIGALVESGGLRRWHWIVPGAMATRRDRERDAIRSDVVGWSTAFDHDENGVYYAETWVFPEGYDVTEGDVKSARKKSGRTVDANAVDVSVDGRVATVVMHLSLEWARENVGEDADASVTPHVTWAVTRDAEADRLNFHHQAGDPVRTDWLFVEATGSDPETWFSGVGDRVEPGEGLTVSTAGIEPDTTVRLVYRAPVGAGSSTLLTYELP